MDITNHLEQISKLRQRLIRLIKLGEPNQIRSTIIQPINDSNNNNNRPSIDLTANVEECVRRLFNNTCTVETFIQDVQKILNVTIKSNLTSFLIETIPLAHQYLQQQQYDPYSWDIFKTLTLQPSNISSTNPTRLPSLQQAQFRLPPSCPQLIDLTSSSSLSTPYLIPNIRPDADPYQQKLIQRFAQQNFYLNESGEQLFLDTLYTFVRYIIQRLHFYTQHRIDTQLLNSNNYQITSNVREQIRYLIELNKSRTGDIGAELNSYQGKASLLNSNDEEQKRQRTREYRQSLMEELRQKEANETACLVLRESRLKRQKTSDNNHNRKLIPNRLFRANLQDLIIVMENIPLLKRSKTLLYAYANR